LIWKPWTFDGPLPSYVLPVAILLCLPYIFSDGPCPYSTRSHTFFNCLL
jgi:hypothetical protein